MKGRGRRPAISSPFLYEVKKRTQREETSLLYRSDVQMKSSSDSEMNSFTIRPEEYGATKAALELPVDVFDTAMVESSGVTGTLSKRKLFPVDEGEERAQRKKQCVTQMDTDFTEVIDFIYSTAILI